MSIYKQVCVCGHALETHYRDPDTGRRLTCLGLHCNDCHMYTEPYERTTPVLPMINFADIFKRRSRPHNDTTCRCKACQDWEFQKFLYQW